MTIRVNSAFSLCSSGKCYCQSRLKHLLTASPISKESAVVETTCAAQPYNGPPPKKMTLSPAGNSCSSGGASFSYSLVAVPITEIRGESTHQETLILKCDLMHSSLKRLKNLFILILIILDQRPSVEAFQTYQLAFIPLCTTLIPHLYTTTHLSTA